MREDGSRASPPRSLPLIRASACPLDVFLGFRWFSPVTFALSLTLKSPTVVAQWSQSRSASGRPAGHGVSRTARCNLKIQLLRQASVAFVPSAPAAERALWDQTTLRLRRPVTCLQGHPHTPCRLRAPQHGPCAVSERPGGRAAGLTVPPASATPVCPLSKPCRGHSGAEGPMVAPTAWSLWPPDVRALPGLARSSHTLLWSPEFSLLKRQAALCKDTCTRAPPAPRAPPPTARG